MKTPKEAKIEAVRSWLRNHVEPQRQFDGVSSYTMATSIIELIDETEELHSIRQQEMSLEEATAYKEEA